MDRELVLFVLALLLVGVTMPLGSFLAFVAPREETMRRPGRALERTAARRLLLPAIPPILALSALVGWALMEPENAERVPWTAFLMAAPVLAVWGRAAVRAARALAPQQIRSAATIGVLRPRVVVGDDFKEQLDEQALSAALAHEEVHAAHRDPLRIWLAQLVTDVQWPLPGAPERFEDWLFALELSRDEEARLRVDGTDLAAAVVAAARFERTAPFRVAGIASAGTVLRVRVERLLAPLPEAAGARAGWLTRLLVLAAMATALFAGANFGEALMRHVLGWNR